MMKLSYPAQLQQLSVNKLILMLAIFAALLAAQINHIQLGWINNDSVLYFEAARLFAEGEWNAGFSLFQWPLYSALIALMHKLTGFSLHFSAQLLNVLFFTVTTISFLKIIEISGGNKSTLFAGSLILFSSPYVVGDVMQMLMRDQGFWAFFLTALYFFIRFYLHNRLRDALIWQLSILVAMLFRIEAFTYLLLLPLSLIFRSASPPNKNIRSLVQAQSLTFVGAITIGLLLLFSSDFSVNQLGRLREILSLDLYTELTRNLLEKSEIMANEVLGDHLDQYALEGILLTFVIVMLNKAVSATGGINFILAYFGIKYRRTLITPESWDVLFATMLIATLNMLLIITKVFVLSGRYVVALALIFMVVAAFFLGESFKYLSATSNNKRKKLLLISVLIILSLSLVKNILPKRAGHNYEQDAVAWLKNNTAVSGSVYFSTPRLRFYASQNFTDLNHDSWGAVSAVISDQSIFSYDTLVILIDEMPERRTKELKEMLPNYAIAQEFYSRKNKKKVIIFVRS